MVISMLNAPQKDDRDDMQNHILNVFHIENLREARDNVQNFNISLFNW